MNLQKTWPPVWDERTWRYLKVDRCGEVHEKAKELWDEAKELINLRCWDSILSRSEFDDLFREHVSSSRALVRWLGESDKVVLLAVTLGEVIDAQIKSAQKYHETFRMYMLDRIGSLMIERFMTHLDRKISTILAGQGYVTTGRYSPGYKDFHIEAQSIFIQLAQNKVGLKLGPAFQLIPEKSITAVMGASPLAIS